MMYGGKTIIYRQFYAYSETKSIAKLLEIKFKVPKESYTIKSTHMSIVSYIPRITSNEV